MFYDIAIHQKRTRTTALSIYLSFLLANVVGLSTICQDHSVQISSFLIFDRIFSTICLPLLLLVNLDSLEANKRGKQENDTKIDEDAAGAEEIEEEERKG